MSREASAGLGYIYVDEEHCLASMHCPALLPSWCLLGSYSSVKLKLDWPGGTKTTRRRVYISIYIMIKAGVWNPQTLSKSMDYISSSLKRRRISNQLHFKRLYPGIPIHTASGKVTDIYDSYAWEPRERKKYWNIIVVAVPAQQIQQLYRQLSNKSPTPPIKINKK